MTSSDGALYTTNSTSSDWVTTVTTGTGGSLITTSTPPSPLRLYDPDEDTPIANPFLEKDDRESYVSRQLFPCLKTRRSIVGGGSAGMCGCGDKYETKEEYVRHIAKVAIEAGDIWDEISMSGDVVDDDD